jgi:hypothetical protein
MIASLLVALIVLLALGLFVAVAGALLNPTPHVDVDYPDDDDLGEHPHQPFHQPWPAMRSRGERLPR